MQLESGLYQSIKVKSSFLCTGVKNKATSFGSGSNQSHWEIQQTVSVSQEYFWCFERKGRVFRSVYLLQNEFEGHVGEMLPILCNQVLQFLSLLFCFVELNVVIIRNLNWNVHRPESIKYRSSFQYWIDLLANILILIHQNYDCTNP